MNSDIIRLSQLKLEMLNEVITSMRSLIAEIENGRTDNINDYLQLHHFYYNKVDEIDAMIREYAQTPGNRFSYPDVSNQYSALLEIAKLNSRIISATGLAASEMKTKIAGINRRKMLMQKYRRGQSAIEQERI